VPRESFRPSTKTTANVAIAVATLLFGVFAADASLLLAPSVGVPDLATAGTFLGTPATPDSALFMNPAGLVGFETTTYTGAFGIVAPHTEVDSDLVGYDKSDQRVGFNSSGGMSVPLARGWRFGAGFYGSVGTVFDFEAESPAVTSDFVSDLAIAGAPFALAYEVSSRLWLGAELIPLFGYLRNRFPLPDPGSGASIPIEYTLRGPGIGAMFGISYHPSDRWSLGASAKTPGMIWMDGSTVLAGERVDVDCDVKMPTTLWAGATRRFGERFDLSVSVRWTDSSTFGESKIEFSTVSLPFVADAKDEWRFAIGSDYRWNEKLTLRGGLSYASRMVGNKGVSPLLFDTEDIRIGVGASYELEAWSLHTMVGHAFEGERNVPPDDALIFPGEYRASGPIFMLGFTYAR
jgi:long-chain fatty acid transport protein